MENKIVLRIQNDTWMASHFGPHAAEVYKLFGTTVIPTPFTGNAPFAMVQARIQELNPGVRVIPSLINAQGAVA